MGMKFYFVWGFLFLVLIVLSLYGVAAWISIQYDVSWEVGRRVWRAVLLEGPFYKNAGIVLLLNGALSYLAARFTILGRI